MLRPDDDDSASGGASPGRSGSWHEPGKVRQGVLPQRGPASEGSDQDVVMMAVAGASPRRARFASAPADVDHLDWGSDALAIRDVWPTMSMLTVYVIRPG